MRIIPAVLAMALSGCDNTPDPYAPPVQRQPLEGFRPYRISRIVNMDDADAESHFVADILFLSGNWRWAGQRPAMRVNVRSAENIRYLADFAIADVTFKETGPVTVSFFVNDRLLEQVKYDQPGPKHFEKAVPPEWLEAGKDAIVAAHVDKVLVSPGDGAKLGLILTRIGLTQ